MIAEIARLKELQASEASATYKTEEKEFRYECEMLNAAPAVLAVLGGFQPGYAEKIEDAIGTLEAAAEIKIDDGGDLGCSDDILDCLRRMAEMARKMEES
jgi:hypothetical protein